MKGIEVESMKCPKCKQNMNRIRQEESNYYYECPKCHLIIGKKETESDSSVESKDEES